MSAKEETRRIIRDRFLTPEEIAEDKEIRRKVMQEFPPKYPNMKIGRQLKQMRQQQGLTPEEFAQRAGVSNDDVQAAEQGSEVPLSTFVRMADALGCQLSLDHPSPSA